MNASTVAPDVILHGGRITTLDRANPLAEAVAITGGRFSAVGRDADIRRPVRSTVTTTPPHGRAACQPPTSRASGARSAVPAGRFDVTPPWRAHLQILSETREH
jgi:hypothetical protein